MGYGQWSTPTYRAAATYRTEKGLRDFAYSDSGARVVHQALNPGALGAGGLRESRDSAEHPNSVAVMVILDVTGSMGRVPGLLQKSLPELYDMLLDKGWAVDPQIMFGAVGDANWDKVPLQIGQFESDNRADEDLRKIVIEKGGGGGDQESYELALYFAARKTATDCLENRDHKGYLFIVGDEKAYDAVSTSQVKAIIGDDLDTDIPVRDIVQEAQEMYNVYYILPEGAAHRGNQEILDFWRGLLGQNVIELSDLDNMCEVIGSTIGLGEGKATPDEVKASMSASTVAAVL